MTGLDAGEVADCLKAATVAARGVSKDPQVIGGAADFAVQQLRDLLDSVEPEKRKAWVRTVARREARRAGAKLHREAPYGRQGSLPPRGLDGLPDEFVEAVIAEMHHGPRSLGSEVAAGVDLDRAWATLSEDARRLLWSRYALDKSTKEIAAALGRTPGAVDVALTRAKAAARPLLQDLVDNLDD